MASKGTQKPWATKACRKEYCTVTTWICIMKTIKAQTPWQRTRKMSYLRLRSTLAWDRKSRMQYECNKDEKLWSCTDYGTTIWLKLPYFTPLFTEHKYILVSRLQCSHRYWNQSFRFLERTHSTRDTLKTVTNTSIGNMSGGGKHF